MLTLDLLAPILKWIEADGALLGLLITVVWFQEADFKEPPYFLSKTILTL